MSANCLGAWSSSKYRMPFSGFAQCTCKRTIILAASCLLSALSVSTLHAQHATASLDTAPPPLDVLTQKLPTVQVIATTLLPGLVTPLRDVPANVQGFTQNDLLKQRNNNLAEYLEKNATSITINAAQGNPFQLDVSFRGFTASPLLGVPQGLSVFQDGVRVNEPFGDVVNWDLIPQSAIANIQLIPGSNPVFGLNTLGGALAIYTKRGRNNPGGALEISGGSFGRRAIEFEYGGKYHNWDYFLTTNVMRDRGWAEHNPSRVGQLFSKLGYQDGGLDIELALTLANTKLEGTQTLPISFAENIRQAYTYPDQNTNRLGLLNLKGSYFINPNLLLGGNLYRRDYRNNSVSSNVNASFGELDSVTGRLNTVEATNDRSAINQISHGVGLQITHIGQLATMKNQFIFGASADLGRARFTQDAQDAEFTPSRAARAISPFVRDTEAETRNRYYGLFAYNTLSLNDRWTLTASARSNIAKIEIADRSGTAPGLNGRHSFARVSPALGLNFNPTSELTIYASFNEGMRAPTPIELTCADPAAPCKLPNNFLSDPPLKKVVVRTIEAGARGKLGEATSWSVAAYRSNLSDDILFISGRGAGTNVGYFQNVSDTRRAGVELAGERKWNKFSVTARYAFTRATYESSFFENSPVNSSADATGAIKVSPGNRIAGIPKHSLKLRLEYDASERWAISSNILHTSDTYARGDENNADTRGKVPGYSLVNLDTRYKLTNELEIFGSINNLFNRQYASFGILDRNAFNGPNRSFDNANAAGEQFRGYGAPRGVWVGLRLSWL
jgi:iron complex outermembrane recepter protein